MPIIRAIVIYGAGVLVAGALASYPLHLLFLLLGVENLPFHKLVIRVCQVLALIGLWPLLSALKLNQPRYWGFGLSRRVFVPEIFKGLAIGAGILLVLVMGLFGLEVRALRETFRWEFFALAEVLLTALAAGTVVGLLEEVWFRGALFSAIAEYVNAATAICVTAAFYAVVHFIRADVPLAHEQVTWHSGFVV